MVRMFGGIRNDWTLFIAVGLHEGLEKEEEESASNEGREKKEENEGKVGKEGT